MHLRLAVPFPWQRVSQLLVYLAHFVCRAALCQRALPPMYLCRVETFLLQVVRAAVPFAWQVAVLVR